MTGIAKRLVLLLVFGGLFGAVVLLRETTSNTAGTQPAEGGEELKRYGFYLKESAKEAGLDFVHQAPTLDPKLAHIMPIIASMGAGVSVADFDRDGRLDIYVVNSGEGSKNRLYRNMGDGTFKDVAEQMGVADLNRPGTGVCMGAVWGDFDNDGYEDLLVYKWGRPELFHNDRGQGFTRVTDTAGLPKWVNANSAVWLDFDRDGHLDLFLAGYWADDLDLWHLQNTKMMPESFEFAKNGGRKYLLRNKGDGTFEDVTEKMGITSTRWTLAVAAGNLCQLDGLAPYCFVSIPIAASSACRSTAVGFRWPTTAVGGGKPAQRGRSTRNARLSSGVTSYDPSAMAGVARISSSPALCANAATAP